MFCFVARLNVKDIIQLNLVTYRLNTLSGDPLSQVFYLFCKELRFGDIHSHTSSSMVESLDRTISNLSRWSLKLLFVSINKSSKYHAYLNVFHILDKIRHEVLKNIRNQEILITMGERLYLYFPCDMRIQLYIAFENQSHNLVCCDNSPYLSSMLKQR
jgi:hypothetical protein